jgi:hypothetical protein
MIRVNGPVESNIEMIFEWLIIFLSVVFIFLGVGGLLIVITANQRSSDNILQYAYFFIYFYMLILGLVLLAYRRKILFKNA